MHASSYLGIYNYYASFLHRLLCLYCEPLGTIDCLTTLSACRHAHALPTLRSYQIEISGRRCLRLSQRDAASLWARWTRFAGRRRTHHMRGCRHALALQHTTITIIRTTTIFFSSFNLRYYYHKHCNPTRGCASGGMNAAFQSEYGVPFVFAVSHTHDERSAVYFTCSSWMKTMRTRSTSTYWQDLFRVLCLTPCVVCKLHVFYML